MKKNELRSTVEVLQQTAIDTDAIKRKSVHGAASYFSRTLFLNFIGIVATGVLNALLSPADFGIYGFVVQIVGILTFFSDVGLAAALIQKKTDPTDADYKSSFTVQQILSWGIFFVCLGLTWIPQIANKIGADGSWVLLALAFSFPLSSLKTVPSIILERKLEFNKLVIPQIFEQLVFYAVVVFCAWQKMGVLSYAYAIMARSIIGVIVIYSIQRWNMGLQLSKDSLKMLFSFGVKFQLNDFLARIKDQLFYVVIGYSLPAAQFGYVTWAKTWSMYPYNLTVQNVMALLFPTFSRLQGEPKLLSRAIEKSLFFISLLIFPMIIGMAIFMYPLIDLIPHYAKWQPALVSFVLFSLSIGWSAISTPLTNTLNAVGQINKSLKLMIMWTILTWVVTPLCMRWFGFTGVAIASFLISFTSFIPILYVKKIVQFSVWDQVWRQLVASLVLGVVAITIFRMTQLSWTIYFTAAASAAISYFVVLFLLGKEKLRQEIMPLLSVLLRKVSA